MTFCRVSKAVFRAVFLGQVSLLGETEHFTKAFSVNPLLVATTDLLFLFDV